MLLLSLPKIVPRRAEEEEEEARADVKAVERRMRRREVR